MGREHEERFVKDFNVYLKEGVAPTPGLKVIFAKIKDWMMDAYDRLSGYRNLSPTMKAAFDDMFSPTRKGQEKFLYGTDRFAVGTDVVTPDGRGRIVTRGPQAGDAGRERVSVRLENGGTTRYERSQVTPVAITTRDKMTFPTTGITERALTQSPAGEHILPGDTVFFLPQKGIKNDVSGVVLSFNPADRTLLVERTMVQQGGKITKQRVKVKVDAVNRVEPTATGAHATRGVSGSSNELVVHEVSETPGRPMDKWLINALNSQLRRMKMPELGKEIRSLNQVDPSMLPMIENLIEIYGQSKTIRDAIKQGGSKDPMILEEYSKKVREFLEMYNQRPKIARNEEVPTMGGAATYSIEKVNQLAQKAIESARNGAMSPTGEKMPIEQALAANDYITGSAAENWNGVLLGASLNGQKTRSHAAIDFTNQTRLDDTIGMFAPYAFWKTRTIKNSLGRMLFEPGFFYHLYKLDQMLRDSAPQTYEEEQKQQQEQAILEMVNPERAATVKPPRLSGYQQIPGVSVNPHDYLDFMPDKDYSIYLRWLPSNIWPMFPEFIYQNASAQTGIQDQGEYSQEMYAAMNGGTLSFYPWVNDLLEANANAQKMPQDQSYVFRPGEWTPQTAMLGPAVALKTVPPEEWPKSKWAMNPNSEYYIARALANSAEQGKITPIEMGLAAQWLHHVRYDSPLPPEWETLPHDRVWEILKQAATESVVLGGVEQATRMLTGVTLKLHDPTEDQLRAERTRFLSMFYSSTQDPTKVQNPYGSERGAFSYREQHPGIAARSQAGDLFDPTAVPALPALRSMKFNEGDDFAKELKAAKDTAVGELATVNSAPASAGIAVQKLIAALPIYAKYLGDKAVQDWLGGFADPEDAAFDAYTMEQAVYDQIAGKYPSVSTAPKSQQTQTPYDSQLGIPLRQPVEVKMEERNAALKGLHDVPGRPDYADYGNDNYDAYKQAADAYKEAQKQWFMQQTGLTSDVAEAQIEQYRIRNMSPKERELEANYDALREVNEAEWDKWNANRAPFEYYWDTYKDLPIGGKSKFMNDPANAAFAEYVAKYGGNWWDEDTSNDEGIGYPKAPKLPKQTYTLPPEWQQYLGTHVAGATPGAAAAAAIPGTLGTGAQAPALTSAAPSTSGADDEGQKFTEEWAAWNALPDRKRDTAAAFMAAHPEFADYFTKQYGNYWDDNPDNDTGLDDIPTEPPATETQPHGVDPSAWAEYAALDPEGKAKYLLENLEFRAAYINANKSGWFYWYSDTDGKFVSAEERAAKQFKGRGNFQRAGYAVGGARSYSGGGGGGGYGGGGYGGGGTGFGQGAGYLPDVPNTYINTLRETPKTPWLIGDKATRRQEKPDLQPLSKELWKSYTDIIRR